MKVSPWNGVHDVRATLASLCVSVALTTTTLAQDINLTLSHYLPPAPGHQNLQTTEIFVRTDSAEKLDMLSEWRSPGLGEGTVHVREGHANGDAFERLSLIFWESDQWKRRVMTGA